jgi:protein-tyrosine phosphatase
MISSKSGGWRESARALGRTVAGALHPWRRARAQARLSAAPPPGTILLICHGNLCRSPYAASVLRRLLPPTASGIRIESAGFIGPHRTPPAEALDVAGARGIDLRRHQSRVVTQGAVTGSDLVVVMEPGQVDALRPFGRTKRPVVVLGDLDPRRAIERTIRDPVEQPRMVFAETYDRIDRCLAEVVNTIWGDRTG